MTRSHIAESQLDLTMMLGEFERAVQEIRAIPVDLYRYKREEALSEPLARLELVRRSIEGVFERHGWREPKTSCRSRRVLRADSRQLWLPMDLSARSRVAAGQDRRGPVKSIRMATRVPHAVKC